GRITHEDLEAYLAAPAAGPAPRTSIETVKVIGLRRKIAEKMSEAKRRIPHFSYIEEVDVTALETLRVQLNAANPGRPRLTVLPFFVRALARTLPDFPQINAIYDDEAGLVHRHAALHLGVATQTPSGLVVPVLRHAETFDLWGAASEIARLAQAARAGKATREELSGSSLTITSLGPLGGLATTPVINHPEVAIVGPNRIVERPVVVGGVVVVRKMMNLSSSFDHRVVDGWDAAEFVQKLKLFLENPALMFVEPA
ncbi:MAG TPA: dihydrolipoamide acetyltransferase family protein, partial [Caulobacter sp.]|nr:dihydrolipoamide acetyltransferase family protein [Caulobacter sp.]